MFSLRLTQTESPNMYEIKKILYSPGSTLRNMKHAQNRESVLLGNIKRVTQHDVPYPKHSNGNLDRVYF